LGPFVSFLPRAPEVGGIVQLLGQGFIGTSAVSFNGSSAAFNVVSDTYLTATVPKGATSGFITLSTPGGALKSNQTFLVKPQITSFSPTNGLPGTSVVVTGVSLKQTSRVSFNNAVAIDFTVSSDTQVTVTVPAGAITGKIGITTTGAPTYSGTAFTVGP
jgi:large repetitive protein